MFLLSGNPLVCNCETSWLSVPESVVPLVSDVDHLECETVREPGLVPVNQVTRFLCEYQTHCFSLCRCCSFFGCDCRMKCPPQCHCYHDQVGRDFRLFYDYILYHISPFGIPRYTPHASVSLHNSGYAFIFYWTVKISNISYSRGL